MLILNVSMQKLIEKHSIEQLQQKAKQLRISTLELCSQYGGHVASSFSCVEILVALYYTGILKYDPGNQYYDERDHFILSKGHAETILYAILSDIKFFPFTWLETYYRHGKCILGGHPDKCIPGVEITTGALGHGLGIAAGISLAMKLDGKKNTQFVLLGDAELTEGSVWEAALFASKHKLSNLIGIVDKNDISALEFIKNFTSLDSLPDKWRAFGWEIIVVDGHNFDELISSLDLAKNQTLEKPVMIIANTIKGRGVSFIENDPSWHVRKITHDEVLQARIELEYAV